MSKPRFLIDENPPAALAAALRRQALGIDILCVGEPGAPPKSTPDPVILLVAEASGRFLLSGDRRTIPGHLATHFAAGHHTWGVFLLREGFPLPDYVDEILAVWGASEADEWIDVTLYIP